MSADTSDSEDSWIICDNGTDTIKAGFQGGASPRSVFPPCIGQSRSLPGMAGMAGLQSSAYIGDGAQIRRGTLRMRYPIEDGIVTNWDDMEKIWRHTYYSELREAPEDHHILMTEVPMNPRANRETMAQILFEKFETQGLIIAPQEVMSLLATGKTTGVVVQSGQGTTTAVPIMDGYPLRHRVMHNKVGGREITNALIRMVHEYGQHRFTTTADSEIARDIKEKLGYVARDFDAELALGDSNEKLHDRRRYELPDGMEMELHTELFRAAEALFKPKIIDKGEEMGIHELTYKSIRSCDVDLQGDLFDNIVLAGGNTLFEGTQERLKDELEILIQSRRIRVEAPQERRYSAWLGGAIMTDISQFTTTYNVTAREYEEYGPCIVHRRCLL
eukprot:Hpha_TRINITY_DN30877_c0_g1::TRINITY_DN30877_c0_g1_i1::g.155729::m.155729/K10355/ACTF; actin, other eukaryote